MSLDISGLARQGAALAFSIVDDVLIPAVLAIRPGSGVADVVDPVTDTISQATVKSYNVKGVFYRTYTQKLAADAADLGTFLVRVEELDDQGLTDVPNYADSLTMDNQKWHVIRVDRDCARACYIFDLRRS